MKLGKKPFIGDPRDLRFTEFRKVALLPTPPRRFGHEDLVSQWDVLGNDHAGNCIAEDTLVSATGALAAYRIPYTGPMITLALSSGKRLTVTPNHAVLTTRGFSRAKSIKVGDNLISTRGSQILGGASLGGGENDFNQSPAPAQEVFSSVGLGGHSRREVVPGAVDFHGDEKFFDGDVEVVGTNRFLRNQMDASLHQPECENQIGSTGKLKGSLVGAGAAFLAFWRRFLSPQGNIGFGGYAFAFGDAHAGVAQTQGLGLRAEGDSSPCNRFFKEFAGQVKSTANFGQNLTGGVNSDRFTDIPIFGSRSNGVTFGVCAPELVADFRHPAADGGYTDPYLFRNISQAFPGLVKPDSVVSVDVQWKVGTHVYDLSTLSRWYVANGIVTHNCVFAGACHEHMVWCAEAGTRTTFTDQNAIDAYSAVTGYDPAKPETDNGTMTRDALKYRKEIGITDSVGTVHKIGAFVHLEPGNIEHLYQALYLFGAVGIGIQFPDSAMEQFNMGKPWRLQKGSTIGGGHYIPLVARRKTLQCVTWGRLQGMTRAFYECYCDEAWGILSEDMLTGGKSLEGFDLTALQEALYNL